MSVHAHIHMIEIMYKVGLIKECLKYLFKSHSMGLYFPLYGIFDDKIHLEMQKQTNQNKYSIKHTTTTIAKKA